MLDAGLVAEVAGLLQSPKGLGRTARQALGYREILDHLERGLGLSEAISQLKTHTHQFAKRQGTWFRNLEELSPVNIHGNENVEQVAARILDSANL